MGGTAHPASRRATTGLYHSGEFAAVLSVICFCHWETHVNMSDQIRHVLNAGQEWLWQNLDDGAVHGSVDLQRGRAGQCSSHLHLPYP